jgi:recombination protein RecR
MSAIAELVDALRRLPGVGAKSAQRMVFHLLERDREGAKRIAKALTVAVEKVGHCQSCRTLTEGDFCTICANVQRQNGVICVVETPADLQALEVATGFSGQYFVLHGRLSPLDGLGPKQLGFDLLLPRLRSGDVRELIIATNPTIEGEATAHYLAEIARESGVRATRIAHGVPVGGELEYIDKSTLAHAFGGRVSV